jgi:2-oxoglutarate ferredoxin oxidoreductase subunit beta
MLGQVSSTTQAGRGGNGEGPPLKVCELLSSLDGVRYLERVAVSTPKDVIAAKRAIKTAFQNQIDGKGFSLVEVLSMCPTDWKLSPAKSIDFVNEQMKKVFPLGVIKDAR